jgi:TetR/AcrR family tetracycline transcriptional repressor
VARPPAKRTPRGRGQAAGLTRAAIADAAVAVLDERGLDAVTVRSVASRLHVDASALYNHVRDKDDLLSAVASRCFERLPHIDADDERPIDEQLRTVFRAWRALGVRHPGLLRDLGGGWDGGQWHLIEGVQAALRRTGLDEAEITSTFVALVTITVGSALLTADIVRAGGEEELRARLASSIAALPPDDYPTLRDRARTLPVSESLDAQFEHQLDLVLAPVRARR